MRRVLSTEFLKIRKKLIWFLIFLGPIGVIGLQALNFGLRYDYLMKTYEADLWDALIGNVVMLTIPTLFIGLAIISSMTAGIEHQTNAWKQTLALPITRMQVFVGKFLLNAILLLCSSTLLIPGVVLLGFFLGFPMEQLSLLSVAKWAYYLYFAVIPFLALQVWLSVTMQNQALPLTIGIVGTVVAMFSIKFQDWVPYKWAVLVVENGQSFYPALAGLLLGLLVLILGTLHFVRKDVL